MKTNSWITAGQAKDKSLSPNPLVKFFEEAVIEPEARELSFTKKLDLRLAHIAAKRRPKFL